MRVEIVIQGFRAVQCKELFIYSCFLKLVLNVKTKNDSLRVIDEFHFNGVALELCAHSNTKFVYSQFRLSVDPVACCAKDGDKFDDDDVEGVMIDQLAFEVQQLGVKGRLVVRDTLY